MVDNSSIILSLSKGKGSGMPRNRLVKSSLIVNERLWICFDFKFFETNIDESETDDL